MIARLSAILALALFAACVLCAQEPDAAPFRTATLVIPYLEHPPVIDGVLGDDEWMPAASVNALTTGEKAISVRQCRFWFGWDEDHLYVAMRSPVRPGERLQQATRDPKRDDEKVVYDDSCEIWFDLGTRSPGGQPVFFQYLTNVAGARFDVMHEPAAGNMRIGWTAGWDVRQRLTADRATWEMEVSIPRASLYQETPFTDGSHARGMVSRNFKRPWEQNAFPPMGSFAAHDTYAHLILSRTAPAIHLLSIGDGRAGTAAARVSAFAQKPFSLAWTWDDAGTRLGAGTAAVPAKRLATVSDPPPIAASSGMTRIRVSAGGMQLLDWQAARRFDHPENIPASIDDKADQVDLHLAFNPVHDYLRVSGDFINDDARAAIAKTAVSVSDHAGAVIAHVDATIDALAYVRTVVPLPGLAAGDYVARMVCSDAAGRTLFDKSEPFSKKDNAKEFAWWNTPLGNIEQVISPWTPVRYADHGFSVWNRDMRLGAAGLPSSITAGDGAILAAPMSLVAEFADGTKATAVGDDPSVASSAEHRAVVVQKSRLGTIAVESRVTVEFDGMYRVEMRLTPKEAVRVSSLRIVVPVRPDVAEYIHSSGEGIRYGYYYGFLDAKKSGRIWDSTLVDSQPMVVGSFVPYVWLGNDRRGLCWFADSDQGWAPDARTPAIEIRRDGPTSTDLVLNLVSSPMVIDQPRTITFAFQATPVKPMHPGWRMDTWWTNDSFQDFAQVQPKGGDLIFTALPFPLDVQKSREMVAARHEMKSAFGNGHANAVPYFIHQSLPTQFVPEVSYFGDEWRTSISEGLYYGKTLTDYMIHHLGTWAKDCGIDGFYIDNMRPLACDNIEAGRGYRLPDGRVQPTYQMFETRTYFLRMRAAFAEQGKHNKIVFHMTNNMIIPWVGAADLALDGEDKVTYPEMGKDFMDMWSLERMRVTCPHPWGTAVTFLEEYQGDWKPDALKRVMRSFTGMVLLQDALPSGNHNFLNMEAWGARERFGMEADDVRFIPPWNHDSGLSIACDHAQIAAWSRPGPTPKHATVLLAAVNLGERCSTTIHLDPAKLDLGSSAHWQVSDAETRERIEVTAGDAIPLTIDRHDYRHILVSSSEK
ncbi:MAG: hypothetical protein H0W83_00770 [Planctomycetes bacterium]|nr:hypothetical protein [Planctomycetota bacterium]